jgi:hypothetical protein
MQKWRVCLSVWMVVGGVAACNNNPCLSNRDYFEQRLWAPVLASNCSTCHGPGGQAAAKNSALLLLPASYPNFVDANLENISEVARIQYQGTSELLLKPLGKMDHGGGRVLDESDSAYAALEGFVSRLSDPPSCSDTKPGQALAYAATLDPETTLRRAVVQVTGKLPAAASVEALRAVAADAEAAEAALRTQLQALADDPAFLARLRVIFNDVLLTDRYNRGHDAIGLLSNNDYPGVDTWFDNASDADQDAANFGVAREPLELINYVVRNNKPFTEILTADYTVVNPQAAQLYGVAPTFANPQDGNEFQPAKLTVTTQNGSYPLPHAGLLTMPTFLNRYPTTPTNRNRHRARMVMKIFLATDILKFGERPIDASAGANFANPTRDNPQCNVCHKVLDPMAGDFQKWSDYTQAHRDPNRVWHTDMAPPGFGNEILDTAGFTASEAWLAKRLADDPRFSTAMLHILYKGLIGHEPLSYPTDPKSPSFASVQAAWRLQDTLFRTYLQRFKESGYNLKSLVVDLWQSPFYRASALPSLTDPNTDEPIDPVSIQAVVNLGSFQFLTPELLQNKLTAYLGASWGDNPTRPLLMTDYRLLYGGIDSEAVTVRLSAPNGLMANLATSMAVDMSCASVARDFGRPAVARRFFPHVELKSMPQTADGAEVPKHVEAIKKNIAFLHQYLLGESDAAEEAYTYDLFFQTWREGYDAVQSKAASANLPYSCQLNTDDAGAALPDSSRIYRDGDYTVRAWMAVMTYLLSDYRFLHD